MIITEKIKIKVTKMNIKHLISKGYDIKLKDIIEINSEDLSPGNHTEVKVKCDICNKEKKLSFQKYIKNIKNDNFYACSSKCAQEKVKKTNIKKFGKEYYAQTSECQKKISETEQLKYGCRHHFQNINVKQKQKITNLKLYGVENVFACNEIKNKIKKTNMLKYGVENPSYSTEIKEKLSKINKNIWNNKALKEFNILSINGDNYEMKCDCNKDHNFIIHRHLLSNRKTIKTIFCTICNPTKSNTGLQSQIKNFITELNINTIYNNRSIIPPLELDIYMPELKLAFEFDGLYWHNELKKENNYHLNKTEECEKRGIQLIHIYEDDWLYKKDIIKSMILNKLNKTPDKIFARKTIVKEITNNKLLREFLDKNHIQGFIGSKVKIGLYYNNELVSLMSFDNRRIAMGKKITNEGEYEMLRFCNKLNTNIIGGASKLFKYFVDNYKPKEITTYADRSISQGKLYNTLGFKFINKTQPNYYYIIDGIRHHRFNFRKDILIKEGFDPNKTEHEIMLERNIFRIYDSGNLIYNIKI